MNLAQFRMARAALDWTSRQLAAAADTSMTSVSRFFAGHQIDERDLSKMRQAFEAAGIVFLDERDGEFGVKLRRPAPTKGALGAERENMARKPSFDFERRERDKAKVAKRTEKTKAKSEKKADGSDGSDGSTDKPGNLRRDQE